MSSYLQQEATTRCGAKRKLHIWSSPNNRATKKCTPKFDLYHYCTPARESSFLSVIRAKNKRKRVNIDINIDSNLLSEDCSGKEYIEGTYLSSFNMSISAARNATPKLVENTLRDFYNYLKSIQLEQLSSTHPEKKERSPRVQQQRNVTWDKKGIQSYLKSLKHFGNLLKNQIDRFPNDEENQVVKEILQMIAWTLRDSANCTTDVASRSISPLLELVVRLWDAVQVIDLDRLIDLLAKNHVAGESIEGQDVLLLLGAAGSGKTTTLHYLAGTMFEETEVDGFLHIQPKAVADPILATYETSSGRDTVTRALQTAQIEYYGQTLVLCDTPSLVDADGVEENIAHGLGMVRALQKAKSVRPVLVISKDGMGVRGRLSAFSETVSSIVDIMGNGGFDMDFSPFHYVFTKYEEKHKSVIHKQFQTVWKQPYAEPGKVGMVRKCVNHIIRQTTPEAEIVQPLQERPVVLLDTLIQSQQPPIENPQHVFKTFVSPEALEKLDVQLQLTLGDMTQALLRSDYGSALYRLQQLKNLASLLPEIGDYAKLGIAGMMRHASVLEEQTASALKNEEYEKCIDRLRFLYKFTREIPEAISTASSGMEAAVQHVIAPRENILQTLDEIRIAVDDKQFSYLLVQLKNDMKAVLKNEILRSEIRSIQERILCADPSEGGNSALMNVPCMPARTGDSFCNDQVKSLTDLLITDIPDFHVDWLNMDGLISNRTAFLKSLQRLKEVSTMLEGSPSGQKAADVCDHAYSKFYDVVDKVLSREEKTCQSPEDLHVFEQQAWFLILLKEASEVYENSSEGPRSYLLYQQAFNKFYTVVEHVLSNAETNFLASSSDLDAFERQARFLALLRDVSDSLQNSPGSTRAASVYEQAFTLFYAVVASVLSEAEKSFSSRARDLPSLERQARFLALLNNVSSILRDSPGGKRAASAYKSSFTRFYDLLGKMLGDVEDSYLSDVQNWEALENICWFLALLIQGKLKYVPEPGTNEEKQIKALEQRLLTLMLRTELEVTDTLKLVRNKKILSFIKNPDKNGREEIATEIQFLNLKELSARRSLLVSVTEMPKIRKLLPRKMTPEEVLDGLNSLDKQLTKFFAGQVLNAVQEYNMVVELQKKGNKLMITKQIAVTLRSNIIMAKEDFAVVRSWSKELATKTESNWRRLGALKKCVELGITKLDKMIAKERGSFNFGCGAFGSSVGHEIVGSYPFVAFCQGS